MGEPSGASAAPAAAEPRYLPLPKKRQTHYHQPPSEGVFNKIAGPVAEGLQAGAQWLDEATDPRPAIQREQQEYDKNFDQPGLTPLGPFLKHQAFSLAGNLYGLANMPREMLFEGPRREEAA